MKSPDQQNSLAQFEFPRTESSAKRSFKNSADCREFATYFSLSKPSSMRLLSIELNTGSAGAVCEMSFSGDDVDLYEAILEDRDGRRHGLIFQKSRGNDEGDSEYRSYISSWNNQRSPSNVPTESHR